MMKKIIVLFLMLFPCLFADANSSVTISDVWLEFGVDKDEKHGMMVHTKFDISGMMGEKVTCMACFYDSNKNDLKSYTAPNKYLTTSNTVVTYMKCSVTYSNSVWNDLKLFIPYKVLNFTANKSDYYCRVYIINEDNTTLAVSDYIGFKGWDSSKKDVKPTDRVDNSERIEKLEAEIRELDTKIKYCKKCDGKGYVYGPYCSHCGGSGIMTVGMYTPQYLPCTYCYYGVMLVNCSTCKENIKNRNIKQVMLNVFKEQHGKRYSEIPIVHNDLGGDYNSASDDSWDHSSSSSSSSSCSICGGTGVDPFALDDPSTNVWHTGLCYTNQAGTTCRYCGKSNWHQHARCPKCNVR